MVSVIETATDDPVAHGLLTEYFESRELGFTGGVYRTVFPDPERFVPPVGVFLLVVDDEGTAVGCGGIRSLAPTVFEVKHLFLRAETRGRGWGSLLLHELERRAVGFGATEIVLDTNASLTSAGALYRSAGYQDVEPYNDNPNATNWYRKRLVPVP
ncbi:GNAT family N-acetyltransferase [Labedella phragmitis]|uniref:GNAT family N-acetyltransferase n=1 Tax=Labedella phragmitis TaxID=2498849 RepID=A0A3S3Z1F4_9MICO|nr:GNAT family N-acetyltransferase [Labedella phragmitis]RWZ46502.1 GNAT family N-acetyltransferase [Labedella phragmitis]